MVRISGCSGEEGKKEEGSWWDIYRHGAVPLAMKSY